MKQSMRMMLLLQAHTLIVLSLLPTSIHADTSLLPITFEHVSVVSLEQLEHLSKSTDFFVVYYFVKDSPSVREFLLDYERSAKFLRLYKISVAVHDCSIDVRNEEKCKQKFVHNELYTYKDGNELTPVPLDTMFDVNSIIANTLQLALLLKVPLLKTKQELRDLQRTAVGKQDILVAYFTILGTQEHRIFLEVAHSFQDQFQFALTTDLKIVQVLKNRKVLKPKEGFAMFVLLCADSTSHVDMSVHDLCHVVLYRGQISFTNIIHFVRGLEDKTVFDLAADGLNDVLTLSDDLPIIFVYYDKDVHDHVMPVAEMSKIELRGSAKVVFVDRDSADGKALSKQQGVSGKLPLIGFKKNGILTFSNHDNELTTENIKKFITSIVFPSQELTSDTDVPFSDDSFTNMGKLIDEVQTQDDQIAEAVAGLSEEKMDLEYVHTLLKPNFNETVMNAPLKMVLFYLPFDHMSMAFLRVYGHAAQTLATNLSEPNVLAQVNCFDGTDVCASENITVYPLVRIYQKGQATQDYMGSLDSRSVIKAVKLLRLQSPVILKTKEEVKLFLTGDYPQSFRNFTPSSVLLLTSNKNTGDEELFRKVAKSLSTVTAFGVIHEQLSSDIAKIYGIPVPSVLAVHRSDINQPIRNLKQPLTELSLTDFVRDAIITALPELTVMNLPALLAKKQPFAILFLDTTDPKSKIAKENFTTIAMSGQIKNITFCWMNAKDKTMGQRILSEYTWKATLPMITVVDHKQAELFNFQTENFHLDVTSDWLVRVLDGKIRPSKLLDDSKWLPPGPHYDFLAMIDKLEKHDLSYYRDFQRKDFNAKPIIAPVDDEQLRIDYELREELIELTKRSRVYPKNMDKKDGSGDRYKQRMSSSTAQVHLEL